VASDALSGNSSFIGALLIVYLPRCPWIGLTDRIARIMLSIAAFGGLRLGAAVSQVILTRYSRRHAGNYCLAYLRDVELAGAVDGDNPH
jgi:hypothetical protein